MSRYLELLGRLRIDGVNFLGVLSMFTILAAISVGILFRYVLQAPLMWIEELARYTFIWNIYIGLILASREEMHPKLDFIVKVLPERFQSVIRVVNRSLVLLMYGVLVYLGIETMLKFGVVRTVGLEISWAWMYLTVPFAFTISIIDEIVGVRKHK